MQSAVTRRLHVLEFPLVQIKAVDCYGPDARYVTGVAHTPFPLNPASCFDRDTSVFFLTANQASQIPAKQSLIL